MRVRKNSIVTPIVPVNRTTIGEPYKVTRVTDKTSFIIIDDYGIERMCYFSDFKLYEVSKYKNYQIAMVLILSSLVLSIGLLYFFS